MRYLSLFSGCGGMDLGLESAGMQCVGQIEILPYALKLLKKHWPEVPKHTDISTFCVEDGLAKAIQRPTASEPDIQTHAAVSGQRSEGLSESSALSGLSERMFPAFSLSTMEKTFGESYPISITSGMVWRGECWTVDSSESPRDAVECSLSQVLEASVPAKYYLSNKAIAGMLRRSLQYQRSGYVFQQETGNGKTLQLKTLSLQSLLRLITDERQLGSLEMKAISSPTQCQQTIEGLLSTSTKKILLRKLTPNEKEQLQGFPRDWTLCEG